MAEVDPRRLIIILEDLDGELSRWTSRASAARASAAYTLRQTGEQIGELERRGAIAQDQALTDAEEVERHQHHLQELAARTQDARAMAEQLRVDAVVVMQQAEINLALWQDNLAQARAWLARAEERVRLAELDLANAEAALARAQAELRAAEAALAACRSYRDEKGRGRNCSGPAARVLTAQVAVTQAATWVTAARAELASATAERARAQQRVQCCERAVDLATVAVETAVDALSRADVTLSAAERSVESASAAGFFCREAAQQAAAEADEIEALLREIQVANRHFDDVERHFRLADRAEETAQRLTIIARQELQGRVDLLYFLNRTEGHLSGSSLTTSDAGVHTVRLSTTGSRRAASIVEKKLAQKGVADLSSPAEWGKFAHAAVADYILDRDPSAQVELPITVIGEDGQLRKGRIDVLTQGIILDVKTHQLENLADAALHRQLDAFAVQLQGYQSSPDVQGSPTLALFIEFRPKQAARRQQIEGYLIERGIHVIWGQE